MNKATQEYIDKPYDIKQKIENRSTKFAEHEATAIWSSLSKSIARYQDVGDHIGEYQDGTGVSCIVCGELF